MQKQNIAINFAQGLDTKTDPKQVQAGKFLSLQNSIFTEGGLLKKRNGYGKLAGTPYANIAGTPASNPSYLTTLNDNLTAIGTSISSYSSGSQSWVSKGNIQPLELSVLPLIRNNLNQIQCDSVIAQNGLICTVYTEDSGASTSYKYAIADSVTGQNVVAPTAIPVTSGTVTGSPRVFLMVNTFVIVFTNVITATSHLQYISINSFNPTVATTNTDIAASYISSTGLSWDGVVVNTNLYIGYNTTSGGQAIKLTYLTHTAAAGGGAPVTAVSFSEKATLMSLCADTTNPAQPVIWATTYRSDTSVGYSLAVDQNLNTILSLTQVISSGTILNIASAAQSGVLTVFKEVSNNYSWGSIPSHYVQSITCTQSGSVGASPIVIRSVGLASKAFIVDGVIYFLSAFQSTFQPTYFLVNGSTSTTAAPVIVAKLAYENGGGYLTKGLPSVTITNGSTVQFPYLFKDLIEALNTLGNSQQTTAGGIYSQTGVNLATVTIGTENIDAAEIGGDLHISGGFLWMYDGYLPVEHNFFVWPDDVNVSTSTTGGSLMAQQYAYQAVYSWSDNNGNIFRSAPSIPVMMTTTGSVSTNTIKIPTYRLTHKVSNQVKIELYRWSTANQLYYQITSIASPLLNDTTADSVTFTDTLADSSIIGNNLIYTTGGVVEDVNAPASNIMTLFDTRLWLVDSEDRNLLWYSKQVIEATPVEMSDLFTTFVGPTTGVEGSTGPIAALNTMDDKLIIFKKDAIYYISLGSGGPDNTGANSGYSQPVFITSTVGCSDQQSISLINSGLMFESDKGIWLLDRSSLMVQYIGAAVERFNDSIVESAVNVPKTTQGRFTLDTGQTLMYDYFYEQWGTFTGVPSISSTIYQGRHTFLNQYGEVFQETPGQYLDGTNPVLMQFTTSWIETAGLSGFQRLIEFILTGSYVSPHKLLVQIAYDFGASTQQSIITPTNYTGVYGSDSLYGQTTPYGGPKQLEQWRIQAQVQRCQAFQISVQEVFDPSYGTLAGEGFTLSAINCLYGVRKGSRPMSARHTAG